MLLGVTIRRMTGRSPRTPTPFDLWVARHPVVALTIAVIAACCAWLILFVRPEGDGPLTWLAFLLTGLAGFLAIWPFSIRKRIASDREGQGYE
jgi:hypothetical protein